MPYYRWFNLNVPLISHNLFVSKGQFGSIGNPDFPNLFTIGLSGKNKKREQVFEEIRAKEFPNRPSRRSAVWLFDDYELAQKCGQEWGWVKQGRDLIEVEIVQSIKINKLDSSWIDCASEYETSARNYWSGVVSVTPAPEILFEGILRLLGNNWRSKCKLMEPGQSPL